MLGFIKRYLLKKQIRRDNDYKEAVHYACQHFKGEELDKFLELVDSIYDNVELVKREKRKK